MPPKVVPRKTDKWTSDQPDDEILPSLPARMLLLGPSGAGKTQLIASMCLDFFRKHGKSCFSRIYIFSLSVLVDAVWKPVIHMCRSELGQDDAKEPFLFETYNPDDLERVITTQQAVIKRAKEAGLKKLFNILILIDDFADNPSFTRREALVHSLFVRGRHAFISSLVSTQKLRAVSPFIRTQALSWFVYRLRSQLELEAFCEEVSALADKKTIYQYYKQATEEPYSFLYVRLDSPKPEFWVRFERLSENHDVEAR